MIRFVLIQRIRVLLHFRAFDVVIRIIILIAFVEKEIDVVFAHYGDITLPDLRQAVFYVNEAYF